MPVKALPYIKLLDAHLQCKETEDVDAMTQPFVVRTCIFSAQHVGELSKMDGMVPYNLLFEASKLLSVCPTWPMLEGRVPVKLNH